MSPNYFVSRFGSFLQLFAAVLPEERFEYNGDEQGHGQTVADTPRQIKSILEQCRTLLEKEEFSDAVVMSNFFLADIGKKELVRQIINETKISLGAATFIPQPPADGYAVSAEIWAMKEKDINRQGQAPVKWFFTGDVRSDEPPVGAYARSLNAFQKIASQMRQNGFAAGQLLRTWIYQGHLVLPEGNTQRYKELNRARTDFFHGVAFLEEHLPHGYCGSTIYPASTGIGADDVDV
ncbi:MAG: hypothetical protein LBN39_00745, partial [Planctomycetaceae bacterium]|nr:hypothetical protein [Planctomycetaceae bacterium]